MCAFIVRILREPVVYEPVIRRRSHPPLCL
jgi:hypothetical protein